MPADTRLLSPQFPRTSGYNPDWLIANAGSGAHTLWITEWLASAMDLKPGMRVLDLGCGRALSSVFLRREFGVQVWAVDLWIDASTNLACIRDAGAEDGVFPIHADARTLPFANEFFDSITSIDAYYYFGTDDTYLNYLARFVKPGGQIGMAGAGLMQEIDGPLPETIREWWMHDQPWGFHSAAWWKRHWEKTGIVDVELADAMPCGWQRWLDWHKTGFPDNTLEIKAVEADAGKYLGYVRTVGRRRADATLFDPLVSFPVQYVKKPMLR